MRERLSSPSCRFRLVYMIGLACTTAGLAQNPGPGIPAITYPANQLFTVISRLNSSNGAPRGHGNTSMVNGYVFIIFADDAGGGNGSGGFAFFDVSNPYSPVNVFTTSNNPNYGLGPDYPGDIREGHSFSFTGNYACIPTRTGLTWWDFTNVGPPLNRPHKIGEISQLTGVSGGDYAPTPWWICWQGGRYVYVAGTSTGLHIIDATNPAAPVYVNRGSGKPNPIPTSQTGGFNVGTIFAIGNMLVITANDASGMATMDISDPVNPVLLNVVGTSSPGYSAMVNGGKILGIGDPLNVWNIADNGTISFQRNAPDSGDKGGYGMFHDGAVFMGCSTNTAKINISNPNSYVVAGKMFPTDSGTDMDFNVALGNLQFGSDDHGIAATYLSPHQSAPDTTGPAVNWIFPRPNAVNQALTSRVGLTMTDHIDIRTVNTSTFIVRPPGLNALPGKYSQQTGILNFWPDSPLAANTTYEVKLPAGGIKDFAGNAIAADYTSLFSTGSTINTFNVNCTIMPTTPVLVGQPVTFDITGCTGNDLSGLQYSWNFGDGTPATAPASTSSATHTYALGLHFQVLLTVTKGTSQRSFATTQTVTFPLQNPPPRNSSTIVLDATANRVWLTNPDANTVTAIDAVGLTKALEVPVGKHPRTLAKGSDGNIWVTNEDDATLSVLDATSGANIATVPMPYGSRPFGILFGQSGEGFVTLDGRGELVKIDPVTRTITGTVAVGRQPRGIAISSDGSRLLVTQFISPVDHGEVTEVNPVSMTVTRISSLVTDPGPDREDAGRGVPNYLLSVTISPDGRRAFVPSKKDNTLRGTFRDGQALTFESTVRTIVSQIDLSSNTEVLSARRDINDRGLASAVVFSARGDYAFVATLASNSLEVFDAYDGRRVLGIDEVGLAPQGLALSSDASRIFIHNYMSRDVAVYNVTDVGAGNNIPLLARINTVASELLTPQVLHGKQIFYNAADRKMSRDRYISCAVCHLDGDSDERVWDFTDRGEGLRNTISLVGRRGMGQGPVHWTANFDEIQDFENDIRNAFNGLGFMDDGNFNNHYDPLDEPKAGLSADLDALAAYVSTLRPLPASPYRNPDGSMTADAIAGDAIFHSAATGCVQCHAGPQLTDSEFHGIPFLLHNVGTIKPSSGNRRGQTLTGIDTPSLKAVWDTAPYLHDGSAATLMDVITTANPSNQHGSTSQLSATQKQQLVAYLLQIDNFSSVDADNDGDIDQSDFSALQLCYARLTGPYTPKCDWADLNGDGWIDGSDFSIMHACLSGANVPANINCPN